MVFLYSNYKCILPTTSSFLLEISFLATYITIFLLKPFPEVYSPLLSLLVFRSRGGFTIFLSSFFPFIFPLSRELLLHFIWLPHEQIDWEGKETSAAVRISTLFESRKKATHHKHLSAIPMWGIETYITIYYSSIVWTCIFKYMTTNSSVSSYTKFTTTFYEKS